MNAYFKKVTVISILVVLFMMVYMFAINSNIAMAEETSTEETVTFAGGTGTSDDPYIIETKAQLNAVRNNLMASYKLGKDITFQKSDFGKNGAFYNEGKRWEPIGTVDEQFSGNFDGNGHNISNIIIYRKDETNCGLFSYNYGEIKNLQIINFNIVGEYTCGGIVACNYGTIKNCSNHGEIKISAPDSYADLGYDPMCYGTICGYNGGTISKCFNTANIYSEDFDRGDSFAFGGIACRNGSYYENAIIEKCYNTGNISTTRGEAGGIVASDYYGTITDCYNSGEIKAYKYAGGIAATNSTGTTISNCYSVGLAISIYDKADMGGIVGWGKGCTACYYLACSEYYDEDSEYGTACTVSQMMKKSTYKGFDFNDVWEFDEDSSYGFPTLKGIKNYASQPQENTIDFAGGYGTKSNPYIIKTKEQLDSIRKEMDACFRLDADIIFDKSDFESGGEFYNDGKGWEPLGKEACMFMGTFNGNGHTIEGLKINRTEESNVGLFGSVNGNIRNLKIINVAVNGGGNVGGVAGYMECGDLSNCEVHGTISVYASESSNYGYNAGGIVGEAYRACYIDGCINRASIISAKEINSASIGGIVGEASSYSKITASGNYGSIQCGGGYGNAGGIAGKAGTVEECFNVGNIDGAADTGMDVGGIAGRGYTIKNSYNIGEVISKSTAGGISSSATTVSNCYNIGSVSVISAGESDAWCDGNSGGIVGENAYNVDNCYNVGAVTSNRGNAGGIAGSASSSSNAYIKQCYNIGIISCDSGNAGAVLGEGSVTISNCFYLDTLDKGVGSGTDGGTKSTSSELQNVETYGEAFDFDYDEIWAISDTADYKYPILTEVVNPELQYTLSAETRDGVADTPTAKTYGNGKITVNATAGQMYVCLTQDKSMSVIPSFSSSEWKKATSSTLTFDGLEAGTTYEIYTYIPASGSQKASYISQALVITLLQVGDPTGDGNVDFIDALYMKRALAGWDGYAINFSACDVDGNGEINDADVMYLERHIAGWKDCENLPKTTDKQTASA